jgi:hypothetical protein
MKSSLFPIVLSFIIFSASNAQVNIIVNKGPFKTVQQAATGENQVNFFDEDLTDDRACTECFAATELAKYLPLVTGIKPDEIRFGQPGPLPKAGNVFIIGSRRSNQSISKYKIPEGTTFETEQSFSIRSFSENDRVVTLIEGADRTGSLYGVYSYLQILGIRFIGLGETGTILPKRPAVISAGINLTENPSYLTRGFYTWGDRTTDTTFFYWLARNKFNYWTVQNQPYNLLKKLGVKLSDGGHRIQGIVFSSDDEYPYNHPLFKNDENKPKDPYKVSPDYAGDTNNDNKLSNYEAHPEWYGMKNGVRTKIVLSDNASQSGINFCTSNEEARKEFARRIVQQLINGQWKYIDLFEFWLFDGRANIWCSCDNCKAAGSFTDKMLMVTYDILKELEKARNEGRLKRRIEVCGSAYHATLEAPTKPLPQDYDYKNSSILFSPIGRCYVHNFADPACTEINQWQLKAYQGWTLGEQRYYKGSMFLGEYYNVSSFKSLPVIFTERMAVDIPWYYKTGTRQFQYMHVPDTLWGTWTLTQYLLGQLLWNVNADAGKIISEYFTLYYPTTTISTRKFYEHLEKATANMKVFKHYVETENERGYSLTGLLLKGDLFRLEHMHLNGYHPLLNDGTDVEEMMDEMELARKYLDISLISCSNPAEQHRLVEDKERFDYGYLMFRYIYHMIRTSVFHKKRDKLMAEREFAVVEKYADGLRNIVTLVHVSSDHSNALNGFEAAQSVNVFNEFKKLYGR